MNTRIKMIRQEEGLTQSQFADKIGLSRNYVAMIEIGQRDPSDRTISDICRIFNVNPEWLRNGEGPMFMPDLDESIDYISDLLNEVDNPLVDIIRSIMEVYRDLSPEGKEKARSFAADLKRKMNENRN